MMADIGSVAKRRQLALEGMTRTSSEIAERLGLDAPTIPKTGRDVAFLQMKQLETIAEFMKQVATKLAPEVEETTELSAEGTPIFEGSTTTEVWNIPEGASLESAIPALTPEERERLFEQIERDYTVAELKQIAHENVIEYQANVRKDTLINLLIDSGLADWKKHDDDTSNE